MKSYACHKNARNTRRGAMLVLIALCLPLCIIMAAFAINVAWMQLVRTELRTSTDAAARAAQRTEPVAKHRHGSRNPPRTPPSEIWWRARRCCSPIATSCSATARSQRHLAVYVHARRKNAKRGASHWAARQGFADRPCGLCCSRRVFGVKQFQPVETATSTQLDRDICLVVDRSGSMMWTLTGSQLPPGAPDCGPPDPTRSRWGALEHRARGISG